MRMLTIDSTRKIRFVHSPSARPSNENVSSQRTMSCSPSRSFSTRRPVWMFSMSCVFEKEQFWQPLMQVSADLLIWNVKFNFLKVFLKCCSTLVTKFGKSLTPVDNRFVTFSSLFDCYRSTDAWASGSRDSLHQNDDAFCFFLFRIQQQPSKSDASGSVTIEPPPEFSAHTMNISGITFVPNG